MLALAKPERWRRLQDLEHDHQCDHHRRRAFVVAGGAGIGDTLNVSA